MKRRKRSCVWLAAAVLFLAGCSSQEEKGMAQVSVITSASEESTSETETENCEETSQANFGGVCCLDGASSHRFDRSALQRDEFF